MGSDAETKAQRFGFWGTGFSFQMICTFLCTIAIISFFAGIHYGKIVDQQLRTTEEETSLDDEDSDDLSTIPDWMMEVWMDRNHDDVVAELKDDNGGVDSSIWDVRVNEAQNQNSCAPTKGIIISNMLGLLANNLFELTFARLLSHELCWDHIIYRSMWNTKFLVDERAKQCFPNILLNEDKNNNNRHVLEDIIKSSSNHNNKNNSTKKNGDNKEEVVLNDELWEAISTKEDNPYLNDLYNEFMNKMMKKSPYFVHQIIVDSTPELPPGIQDMEEPSLRKLLRRWKEPTSTTQMIDLQHFFIEYSWMKSYQDMIHDWLIMNHEECCYSYPPNNAVIIHYRNFKEEDEGKKYGYHSNVFGSILKQYNLLNRPLWIVCEPRSLKSKLVRDMVKMYGAVVYTGRDPYDAMCILSQASILIATTSSSFSQIPAFMGRANKQVHYPLHTLNYPPVTLNVPEWKYHLVNEAMDGIEAFEVKGLRTNPA